MLCGLGIRPELFTQVIDSKPSLGFLEAHSENYFGDSLSKAKLLELRELYPIALHGVGLSLGRADNLDLKHLAELKCLADEVDPMFVSEHLAWSAYSHRHVPDLLPLPLTEQALALMCGHVMKMQDVLGRQVLVENPSNYLIFDQLQIPEPEFLNELAVRTGCGLLIDINNIYVSAVNVERDPNRYIEALNTAAIAQYHLAGHTEVEREYKGKTETVLIDTHNQLVCEPVWSLFERTLELHGARPALFEWDSDFPAFDVLMQECEKANARMQELSNKAANTVTQSAPKSADIESQGGVSLNQLAELQSDFLDDVFALTPEYGAALPHHRHRVSIYQHNLYGSMQEYLSGVYPATKGVVGSDFFKQMAQFLVRSEAPKEGDLHNYGKQMVDVVQHFDGLDTLPYLCDLIRYEWAMHEAYYSLSGVTVDPTTLSESELLALTVELSPAVEIIRSAYPIYEIHRQSLPDFAGEVSVELNQSQDDLLVYREAYTVKTLLLSAPLLAMLTAVEETQNLLQAIGALGESVEANDLSASLSFLFDKRLLCLAKTDAELRILD